MMDVDLPLLVHGEVTDPQLDVFDREARFIDRVLAPIVERFARYGWYSNMSQPARRSISCAPRAPASRPPSRRSI